jgi:hypothetical protein
MCVSVSSMKYRVYSLVLLEANTRPHVFLSGKDFIVKTQQCMYSRCYIYSIIRKLHVSACGGHHRVSSVDCLRVVYIIRVPGGRWRDLYIGPLLLLSIWYIVWIIWVILAKRNSVVVDSVFGKGLIGGLLCYILRGLVGCRFILSTGSWLRSVCEWPWWGWSLTVGEWKYRHVRNRSV